MLITLLLLAGLHAQAADLFPEAAALPIYANPLHDARKHPFRITPAQDQATAAVIKRLIRYKEENVRLIDEVLPAHFQIEFPEDKQKLIDDTALGIFTSASGRVFCKLAGTGLEGSRFLGDPPKTRVQGNLFNDHSARLQFLLGISPAAARKALSLCGPVSLSPLEIRTLYGMIQLTKEKNYFFIFTGGNESIDGFTTKYNTTLFFVHPGLDSAEFTRIFIHELAMSFDQLANLGDGFGNGNTWWAGLANVFGVDNEQFDHDLKAVQSNSAPRDLRCAIRDPSIRYAAAAERAFRFEDKIISELGIPSAPAGVHGSCSASVIHWIPKLPRLNDAIAFEVSDYTFARDCGHKVAGTSPRAEDIVQRLALLARTEFSVAGVPNKFNLCQFMLEPHIGMRGFDLNPGGPRPRAGGWGEADMQLEGDLESLSNGQPVDAQRIKEMDELLKLPDLEAELSGQGNP